MVGIIAKVFLAKYKKLRHIDQRSAPDRGDGALPPVPTQISGGELEETDDEDILDSIAIRRKEATDES